MFSLRKITIILPLHLAYNKVSRKTIFIANFDKEIEGNGKIT